MLNLKVKRLRSSQAVVAHAFNTHTPEPEIGGSLSSMPTWSAEFQDSQGETLSRKTNQQNKKEKKKEVEVNAESAEHSGLAQQTDYSWRRPAVVWLGSCFSHYHFIRMVMLLNLCGAFAQRLCHCHHFHLLFCILWG